MTHNIFKFLDAERHFIRTINDDEFKFLVQAKSVYDVSAILIVKSNPPDLKRNNQILFRCGMFSGNSRLQCVQTFHIVL